MEQSYKRRTYVYGIGYFLGENIFLIFDCRFRVLFDQLVVMAPIMMALSAASPAFQGTLTNVDCRWDVISGSVDDRTDEERGEVCKRSGTNRRMKHTVFSDLRHFQHRYYLLLYYLCSSHRNNLLTVYCISTTDLLDWFLQP